jgi:5-(carboxyamino)imidazole ribonucleotide mutase
MKLQEKQDVISPLVAIIMGSKTDAMPMKPCRDILTELEIPFKAHIISAHRTPEETKEFARGAEANGIEVIIAGAGASAALPGAVAAHSLLPVIGVPLNTTSVGGLDALLAIAQMPGGIPVATMAIGEAGAKNAALLAIRSLAARHPFVKQRLEAYSRTMHETAKRNTQIDPWA